MTTDCPFSAGDQVVSYLRDSGGDEQDQSVIQQESEVRSYCVQHRLTLTQIFKDEAKPGTTTIGRDDFWRMIHHFHDGAAERGVLIWRTNRFGRNINDSQYHKADLRRRGFIIHSLKDNIPEGSAGQFIEFALDWKDQVFIEQLSEDVKRGLRQFVEDYKCVPGTPPRGFKREAVTIGTRRDGSDHIGHRWVPDPEYISLIQRAFEMRAKGATIPQIITATGLYKSVNCYSTFFKNRLYIGELVFGELLITDYCEPLIDQATWDEVQRVGQRRKRPVIHVDHPRRVVSQFILSGLLHCQECGSPMSGHSIKVWDYYVCSRRKRKHECSSRRIPRVPLEREIFRMLEEQLLTIDKLLLIQTEVQNAWSTYTNDTDRTRHDLEKQLAGIMAKVRNVTNAIAEHGHSKALLNQLSGLELQEGDLRASLTRLENTPRPIAYERLQLEQLAEHIKAELRSDDINKTRATIRGLVARVIARRTDDQITGVMYCNWVIGQVPPREAEPKTLLEFMVPVRKRKASRTR